MLQLMLQSFFLFLPAAIANIIPVLVMGVPFLQKPVDFHMKIKGKPIFGDNKTWRGFFFGILGAIVTVYLISYVGPKEYLVLNYEEANLILLGVMLGGGALLGDLVESFFKRRMDILPGKSLWVLDQIDWIIGAVIVFYFMVDDADLIFMLFSIVFFGVLHPLVN